jgi:hypothetical protein
LLLVYRHQAILSYFKKSGFDAAYEAFAKTTSLQPEAKHDGMLENKWRLITVLQKQVRPRTAALARCC